ncbi:MAG: biotin-dependent carboxyltransferase family protein [Agriterribacter sp.]
MSISIIKPGIYDTVQDMGRHGYRHLGINPNGAMDRFSARIVNALAGNSANAPVIESHFPAASLLIEEDMLIAVGGADFSPSINGRYISLYQPVWVTAGSILEHKTWKHGARTYIAAGGELEIPAWLNSYSTNVKLAAGGWKGRTLRKNDRIRLKEKRLPTTPFHGVQALSWRANVTWDDATDENVVYVLHGPEYKWLNEESRRMLEAQSFTISTTADRMGYQLEEALPYRAEEELLSSATTFGTVQLLPGGKIIVLMADHQVSGGYPRIAQVITSHLPMLAQKKPGDFIRFKFIHQELAEALLCKQQHHLVLLQHACEFKLQGARQRRRE